MNDIVLRCQYAVRFFTSCCALRSEWLCGCGALRPEWLCGCDALRPEWLCGCSALRPECRWESNEKLCHLERSERSLRGKQRSTM